MTVLLAVVLGWCLAAAGLALGLGPLLHRAAVLADAHERPAPRQPERHSAA